MKKITLKDLCEAYRKAKVDIYYSSHPIISDIADYEECLASNLEVLCKKINGLDQSWINTSGFLGTWTLATKAVDWKARDVYREKNGNGPVFSSHADEWEHWQTLLSTKSDSKAMPDAEFRVMAQCSIDFHIFSALWMLKVGHLFDKKLSDSSYGNRLRRREDGSINPLSLGSFTPYLSPFRKWRDQGISTMREALEDDKKIIALTADVSSFYHELNPGFMLSNAFLHDVLEIQLNPEQIKLHTLFIRALEAWSKSTPLKKGLPVGLPASAVVANMALIELDRLIEKQVAPLYYGRYVDDILLVIENGANLKSADELWEWLFLRADKKLAWVKDKDAKKISFQPSYLLSGSSQSKIYFSNTKNKVFLLAGETGKTLVEAIAHEIHERASEWRALPRLPQSADHVGTDLLAATQSDGEAADNLRKADSLTMRRAGFAIKLRDFEAYERDLPPAAWTEHRRAFFRAFIQHVVVLPQFFELSAYLPRVIRLATACEDFEDLNKILRAIGFLYDKVYRSCNLKIKAADANLPNKDQLIIKWRDQLLVTIRESIAASFPPQLSKRGRQSWDEHMAKYRPSLVEAPNFHWPQSAKEFQLRQARLFSFDLAHLPFRFIGLPKEMVSQRGIPNKKSIGYCPLSVQAMLPDVVTNGMHLLTKWLGQRGMANGLVFATRPFNLAELFVLCDDPFVEATNKNLRIVVTAIRGFTLNDHMPQIDQHETLRITDGSGLPKCSIAVSSWKTEETSWVASVTKSADPDEGRYSRLNRLLNSVISNPQRSRYLVLPELALPAHWFIRIARKLHGRGISLITGIQYLHVKKGRVRNQVWAALSHDGLGFSSFLIYRQDKQRPALHEEQELQRLAGLEMRASNSGEWRNPPVIQHGDIRFSLLVCSELTNISYRAALRGKIDALFVPEWNSDTETFNALVESAALDIHAYIIQCNDRQYGDSRIRVPHKNPWMRDVLRVKGGLVDYCVIGEIDVLALRQFQSSYRSPASPFKPVPDGFEIQHDRRVLPI